MPSLVVLEAFSVSAVPLLTPLLDGFILSPMKSLANLRQRQSPSSTYLLDVILGAVVTTEPHPIDAAP